MNGNTVQQYQCISDIESFSPSLSTLNLRFPLTLRIITLRTNSTKVSVIVLNRVYSSKL